nr:DUF4349 domain-containing protein [Niabella agricola]
MKRLLFAIAILPWILFACNSASERFSLNKRSRDVVRETADVTIPVEDTAVVSSANEHIPGLMTDPDKKMIKTATVTLEVENYEQHAQKLKSVIKKYGAYIAKEENRETDEKKMPWLRLKYRYFILKT